MVVKKDDNMDFEQMYIKAYCEKGKPEADSIIVWGRR